MAGRVTEQVIAGQGFVRVDVPATPEQAAFTQLYGPGSIYAITPTTEEIATAFVARNVGAPIQPWQLALPGKVVSRGDPTDSDIEMGEFHSDEEDSENDPLCRGKQQETLNGRISLIGAMQ